MAFLRSLSSLKQQLEATKQELERLNAQRVKLVAERAELVREKDKEIRALDRRIVSLGGEGAGKACSLHSVRSSSRECSNAEIVIAALKSAKKPMDGDGLYKSLLSGGSNMSRNSVGTVMTQIIEDHPCVTRVERGVYKYQEPRRKNKRRSSKKTTKRKG